MKPDSPKWLILICCLAVLMPVLTFALTNWVGHPDLATVRVVLSIDAALATVLVLAIGYLWESSLRKWLALACFMGLYALILLFVLADWAEKTALLVSCSASS